MRWQCRRILHQTQVYGAKCVDTLRFYQNVTIDAKCVDRWNIFVTFCDDSLKKNLTWKIDLGLKAGTTDTFMYVTNPISI